MNLVTIKCFQQTEKHLPLPLGLASLAALSGIEADAEAGGVEDVDATAPCAHTYAFNTNVLITLKTFSSHDIFFWLTIT